MHVKTSRYASVSDTSAYRVPKVFQLINYNFRNYLVKSKFFCRRTIQASFLMTLLVIKAKQAKGNRRERREKGREESIKESSRDSRDKRKGFG